MALDLVELEQELLRVRSALDSWATRKQEASHDVRSMHVQALSDQAGLSRFPSWLSFDPTR